MAFYRVRSWPAVDVWVKDHPLAALGPISPELEPGVVLLEDFNYFPIGLWFSQGSSRLGPHEVTPQGLDDMGGRDGEPGDIVFGL